MLKLYDSNIYVGQIKQLLKDFNLPICKISNGNSTGLYIDKTTNQIKYGNDVKSTYIYNTKYLNLTSNLSINNMIYDSYTHKYLGNYLRFLRDYNGIDLMSMYNCFSGDTINPRLFTFALTDDDYDTYDYYNYYCIDIKQKNNYTIGINSGQPIKVFCCLFDGINVLDSKLANTEDIINNCSIIKPYLYTKINNRDINSSLLKLIIRVPKSSTSSIVVIEGDYSNINEKYKMKYFTYKFEDEDVKYKKQSGDLYSKVQLLSEDNLEGNNLISTRLIEYLSNNAISILSEPYDIEKVQNRLLKLKYIKSYQPGIFTDYELSKLKQFCYDNKLNLNFKDIIGYVDKDVESSIQIVDDSSY